ncbi:MAG TPA: hypothetical protein PLP35_09285 [Caldisericia bacterium]|nr:hypothetical protein [Caldisericia bacterium]HRV75736.1 hypothetical protein [Caldisericia bacterium]
MPKNKREEMPDILGDILGTKDKEQEKKKQPEQKKDTQPKQASKNINESTTTNSESEVVDSESNIVSETTTETTSPDIPSHLHTVIKAKPRDIKTTFYISRESYDLLDSVWLKLRKKGISKTQIVDYAIRFITQDYKIRTNNSILNNFITTEE